VSTINKTWHAYAVTILGAEYLTRIVPVGTHHFEKYISPDILRDNITAAGFEVVDMQGFSYDVFNNKMTETSDLSVNYFIAAKKIL
jgi:2-polyprenyl-6-hydroxyphenyl methylase / 3-demethylubiquinone-9 3-methyltransferase